MWLQSDAMQIPSRLRLYTKVRMAYDSHACSATIAPAGIPVGWRVPALKDNLHHVQKKKVRRMRRENMPYLILLGFVHRASR